MIDIFLQEISQPMLLIHASTGVNYINQCEGCVCSQKMAEGFLVPLTPPRDFSISSELGITKVIELTERHDIGSCLFSKLVEVLPKVLVFVNDDWRKLIFDANRAAEVVEAWVPVRCESVKGRATLIWENSD